MCGAFLTSATPHVGVSLTLASAHESDKNKTSCSAAGQSWCEVGVNVRLVCLDTDTRSYVGKTWSEGRGVSDTVC